MTGDPGRDPVDGPYVFCYRAFGLTLRSCLPLPELVVADDATPPDIDIVYGDVPAKLPGLIEQVVCYQWAPGAERLQVDGVATYLMCEGRRIVIERAPDAQDDDVRVFLLGAACGALLQQRGDLVLRGSAVEWDGAAVLLLGNAGAGKSTLALALARRGHAMLTDELCVLRPDARGHVQVHPGFPQAKVWSDSLEALGIAPESLPRVRRSLEKRAVPLRATWSGTPLPVRKIFALHVSNRSGWRPRVERGVARFEVLRTHTFGGGVFARDALRLAHLQRILQLARRVPVTTLIRSNGDGVRLAALVALIEEELRT